jgi:hypothetical protein
MEIAHKEYKRIRRKRKDILPYIFCRLYSLCAISIHARNRLTFYPDTFIFFMRDFHSRWTAFGVLGDDFE